MLQPQPTRPDFTPGYGIEKTNDGLLSWEWATERLMASRNYWVSTTRADGRPHVAPVWGLWMEGAVFFSTDPKSTKGRNLRSRPDVVVHLESGDEAVILEGRAEWVTDKDVLQRFADAYERKYGFRPDITGVSTPVYQVQPRTAFAWRETDFPKSATRWKFER
jgi:PPOX class probable F420-dependent enzyme